MTCSKGKALCLDCRVLFLNHTQGFNWNSPGIAVLLALHYNMYLQQKLTNTVSVEEKREKEKG